MRRLKLCQRAPECNVRVMDHIQVLCGDFSKEHDSQLTVEERAALSDARVRAAHYAAQRGELTFVNSALLP